MRHAIAVSLIAIFGCIGVASASTTIKPDDNFNGKTACDFALDGIDAVMEHINHPDANTQALVRGEYFDACQSIARAHCSDCDGFQCSAPGSQAIDRCHQVQSLTSELLQSETEFKSEQSGNLHIARFNFPMTDADLGKVKIEFTITDDTEDDAASQITSAGHTLYIGYDFLDGARYTCKPVGYHSINDTSVTPLDLWDGRHNSGSGYGAKRNDRILLKDIAGCQAYAAHPFKVVVTPTPLN